MLEDVQADDEKHGEKDWANYSTNEANEHVKRSALLLKPASCFKAIFPKQAEQELPSFLYNQRKFRELPLICFLRSTSLSMGEMNGAIVL